MRFILVPVLAFFMTGCFAYGQSANYADKFRDARKLYADRKLTEAEQQFLEIVALNPSDIAAQMLLGQILFEEQKFTAAITPYEKVRALEKSGTKLTLSQHRILVDQLAMAYGISERLGDSKTLLQESVRSDSDYPLNYYNLACVAAEENDKPEVLKNLTLAFQHSAHLLPGEQMPDPATDPSFQKYAHDADFKALMVHLKTK